MTDIREAVKEKYGRMAREGSPCCDPGTSNLYESEQLGALPQEAVTASLGCGNPTMLAQLREGETVLDLGNERVAGSG